MRDIAIWKQILYNIKIHVISFSMNFQFKSKYRISVSEMPAVFGWSALKNTILFKVGINSI